MNQKFDEPNKSLLQFPCDFTIKIFGLANDVFESTVLSIIRKHIPNLPDQVLQTRASNNGKYLAFTITVHVESKEQLDHIYQDLSSSPEVIMAL